VFILYGLGGIGKTQLAVEFARKHQRTFSAIFWLDGSTHDRVCRSISEVAQRLPENQVPESSRKFSHGSAEDIQNIIKNVLQWLSRPGNDKWLLAFDNVDRDHDRATEQQDPDAFDVKKYFPTADQGSILVTTRLSRLEGIGGSSKVTEMSEAQSRSLLEARAGRSIEGMA
jgi:hypothetical protein